MQAASCPRMHPYCLTSYRVSVPRALRNGSCGSHQQSSLGSSVILNTRYMACSLHKVSLNYLSYSTKYSWITIIDMLHCHVVKRSDNVARSYTKLENISVHLNPNIQLKSYTETRRVSYNYISSYQNITKHYTVRISCWQLLAKPRALCISHF